MAQYQSSPKRSTVRVLVDTSNLIENNADSANHDSPNSVNVKSDNRFVISDPPKKASLQNFVRLSTKLTKTRL